MKNIGTIFIATAAIFATLGMLWGIQMSASADHTLAGAHAHLNLIGWATMAIFGLYYVVVPEARGTIANLHYVLHTAAVIVFVPGIMMAIQRSGESLVKVGSILVVLSMLLFLFNVVRTGFRRA